MEINRKQKFLIAFIAFSLILAIGDYFYAKRASYNKYKSGEYFFREKAHTLATTDAWWTPDAQSRDYTDPKNMLLYATNASVYAYDAHEPFCTVLYGDKVIEDFPIVRLKFENEDLRDFYGTEKYSFKEYIHLVDSLSKSELKSNRVSTSQMANYKEVGKNMWILITFDIALAIIIVLFAWREIDEAINWVLYAGVGYSILFNLGTVIFFF